MKDWIIKYLIISAVAIFCLSWMSFGLGLDIIGRFGLLGFFGASQVLMAVVWGWTALQKRS